MLAAAGNHVDKLVVGCVVLTLGVLGALHSGVAAAELELNDGGVWVTNPAKHLVGHLNYESQTLDGGVRTASEDFDVTQSGNDVLVGGSFALQPLDPASVSFTGESAVADVRYAHGKDLVLFAAKGKVWSSSVGAAGGFNPAAEPLLQDLGDPQVVVGADGTGYVITADGAVRSVAGSGAEAKVEEVGRLVGELGAVVQATVVGDSVVVIDGTTLKTVNHAVELGTRDAQLQLPTDKGGEVIVGVEDALLRVSLGSGEVTRMEAPVGRPSRPAVVGECVFGMWAGSGFFVRDCAGETDDLFERYEELAGAGNPVFRVNRTTIVINDLVDGRVYIFDDERLLRVDDWERIAAQVEEGEKEEDQESEETEQSQVQEFSDDQNPPVANDDELGARQGMATTLPVLANDLDVDGDVLTAVLKDVPSDVSVALTKNGRAVRVEVPGDRTGTVSFTYQAYDGTDLSNVATVTVPIRLPGSNVPPKRIRKNTVNLAERASVSYAVLPDWVDPDGDPLFLENAVGEEGLAVTWRPDGFVSVRDLGTGGPGRKTVVLQVSDGAVTTSEELLVQVSPGSANTPPVANNDHYAVNVGETLKASPLANDTDADGDALRLSEILDIPAGLEVDRDLETGTLQLKASAPGTYSFVYAITDGPNVAKGKIRVDVSDPEQAAKKPAAENDLALLPSNGSVVVAPLSNDFDPAGGVMVLQGLSMGSSEGLNVEVDRHSLLRVTAPAGLEHPETFEYTVSNGAESATAKVLVIPLAAKAQIQPPVALPESTAVRVDDIVTVAVLGNDYSPADLGISLMPELDVRSDPALGEFFVAGDKVRFRAGAEAGQAEAAYTIEDEQGNVATSTVTVNIKGFDEANQRPVPSPVEARTFAGMKVDVAIPMDGVDPDGDSVELVGASGASKGSVTMQGNYLTYEASSDRTGADTTGTDSFEYRVRDRFGEVGTGIVRVGVAPAPTVNQLPVAVPDDVAARPRTRLEIPVTENDLDPDGDPISLVADSVEPITKGWDPQAEYDGQKVIVLTPEERGIYQFYYRITDGGGSPVTGVATVTVDENVPPHPPVAFDDYVPANSVAGLDAVEVSVLDNDFDPDGATDELIVEADAPATVSGRVVTVPLTADRQVVLYTVKDADGLTARAAVVVPGKDQMAPQLDPQKMPARIKGGETLVIDFDEYVLTREGHRAQLTARESVKAGPGGAAEDPELGLKVEERRIEFTPDEMFSGATSISFEVTDGETLEDPRGLKGQLSLPITVESAGHFPPELRPTPVQVAPGERAVEVSLASMVSDPDPGDEGKMSFTLVSASAPFEVDLSGQAATISAPADAQVGATGSLVVRVHDGTTDPLKMTVPMSVIRSTRPLMTVSDIVENEGRVGKAITWNLNDYVTNPFADVGGELEIVGQPSVSPSGSASAAVSGMNLTVTPTDSGDSGEQVLVTYTVADATGEASRQRTGVARITVKGTPNPPVDVAAVYKKSKTVEVSWSHSGWRGGTRKGFLVTWDGGSKDCGLQSSCVIDTLDNNNTYTFTVTAQVSESDIPDSDPSAPSRPIFVDVAPDPPAAPETKFGDTKVGLTWPATTVPDGGSPVSKYTVEISPADERGRTQQEVTSTSFTWPGLKNGTSYTFRLRAHNKQTESGEVDPPAGPMSSPVVPAGAPSQQGAPTVAKDKAAAGVSPRATVSWPAPGNSNGDTSFAYEVRQTGTATSVYTGSANSTVVTLSVGTEEKSFEVRSTNKSKEWSEWSPASNKVRAFQPPGAPSGFVLTPTGTSNQVKFDFGAAAGNGARPDEVSYRWSGGGASGTVTSGATVTNSAFANGTAVSVTLVAISTVNGETSEGGSATATVNAYGPPSAPSVSAARAGNGNVDLSWSMGGSSNGRNVTVEITTSQNGSARTVANSGGVQEGTGPNQNRCVRARAKNSEGQASDWVERCTTTRGQGGGYEYSPQGNQLWAKLFGWYPNAHLTCRLVLHDGTVRHERFQVNGNGEEDRRWQLASTYGPGYRFDTDLSDDCSYS